ncbi:AAA family ATPase [Leptospira stimsonii]|nr:AAA family ATPase [Leptospira stimsonii]
MLLKKIQIKDFRCIEDSGELFLDKVTCLVGKNESGKTAILKALYRIKPDTKKEAFSQTLDFPKKKWKPNQPIPETQVVDTE